MSIQRRRAIAALAALLTFATPFAAMAAPIQNVVLVHGAWVDGSGWRAVHDILVSKGFHVTEVQEPETSFAADVIATKRILDLQDGPTLLVGHSYGGSVITEAGVHPKVVGLVYVAAHAPDVGEDEAALGKRTPSGLARTPGAIARTPDGYTYLTPSAFPTLFAPDLPRQQAEFEASAQVPAAAAAEVFTTPLTAAAWRTKPSWGIVAGSDQIIKSGAGTLLLPAGRQPHDRHQGREPRGLPVACRPSRSRDRECREAARVSQLTLLSNQLYG
jgi:pimeloyl-ACP methyl ester carboxylesterase